MSKPIAFVKNISGPHHHHGGLQTPLGCTVPIYVSTDLAMFQHRGDFAIIPVEDVALEQVKEGTTDAPPEPPSPITLENLRSVSVHGDAEEPKATRVKLADGSIVLASDVVAFLEKGGKAIHKSGWITLYPETDGQVKCQGYEKLAQEIRSDPGLFYPPDADAPPPAGPAEDVKG
jgi:hypothetical protein